GMALYLYQSNLVRDSDMQIHPENVKTAKLKCLSLASNKIELFFWLYKNIPVDHIKFSVTPIVVDGAIVLINTLFKDGSMESYESLYDKMIKTYKEVGEKSKVALSIVSFINFIADIKKKAHKKNMDSPKLLEQMEPYSISKTDLDPWIAPKYASLFNISCCFIENFSTLSTAEYLSPPLKKSIGSKDFSGIDNDKYLVESNEVVAGSFEYFFGSNRVDLEKKYGTSNVNSLPTLRRSDLFTIINRYDIDPFYYRKSISNIKNSWMLSSKTETILRGCRCCDMKNTKPCEFANFISIDYNYKVIDDAPGKCGEARFEITTSTMELGCFCCDTPWIYSCQKNICEID
ncbi:hypothetical protein BB558_007335, partial [Smittium angustum]